MICPISANGDIIGLVILTSETKIKDSERNIAIIASQFLGKILKNRNSYVIIALYLNVMKEKRENILYQRESY